MKLAILSDVFPPKCGGSGWSSFYLAKALQERGHEVQVVVPKEATEFGIAEREYEGLPITEYLYSAAHLPFIRNYTRNERLYPRFGAFLVDFFQQHGTQLVHAQHYLTIPPAVMAAHKLGIPSIATVRDYWAVCYWTTMLSGEVQCPGCTALNRVKCLYRNQGAAGALAAPVSLYMAANLKLKQRWLAQANRVLAVSGYIAGQLQSFVPAERLSVIPNFIDLEKLAQITAQLPAEALAHQPYLFYAGKLEANKGVKQLLELLEQTRPTLPTLIAGEGSYQAELERAAPRLNLKLLGWVENAEVLRLMQQAQVLLFPSQWGEPLSRVLLEAMGVGAVTLAMDTGGTPDIIRSGENGWLAKSTAEMAQSLQTLLQPESADVRQSLRENALLTARQKFSREVVITQVERIYQEEIAAQ